MRWELREETWARCGKARDASANAFELRKVTAPPAPSRKSVRISESCRKLRKTRWTLGKLQLPRRALARVLEFREVAGGEFRRVAASPPLSRKRVRISGSRKRVRISASRRTLPKTRSSLGKLRLLQHPLRFLERAFGFREVASSCQKRVKT